MKRIPLRIIEITLENDPDKAVKIFDWLADTDAIPCCDGTAEDSANCPLLTMSATVLYMDEETGVLYEKPEGGLPHYTADLDDVMTEEVCGKEISIHQGENHWITTCTQPTGHEGPHVGPITW